MVVPRQPEVDADIGKRVTRRGFLESMGVAVGGLVLTTELGVSPAQSGAIAAAGFGGGRALRAAMHVHGSWSEQDGSWEAQLDQAASNGYDLLYLTDHDTGALARDFITSLSGIAWDPVVSSGRFARRVATVRRGSFHLLAESAADLHPASITLAMQAEPLSRNRFRTSVSGLTIRHRADLVRLGRGAHYDVILALSYHPSQAGRPAGQYRLIYRFGAGGTRRWTEDHGLTGVVGRPRPSPGSTQVLVPARDIAAIWPEMVAIDNGSYGLSFRATSPRRGAVCDVRIGAVRFDRSRSTAARFVADQAAMLAEYRSRFRSVAVHASIEASRGLPHMIPYGIRPWSPDYSSLSQNGDVFHQQISNRVHTMGGLISYNHPFGYDGGPLLSPHARKAKRRRVFTDMQAVGRFGADILEVGYTLRGNVDCQTHLALWDTFSRNGDFLTGNGVTDDHSGRGWRTRRNGFATGVWAASTRQPDMVEALAAGRAFAAHAGRWPGELDLLVDESVPMGAVSVSSRRSRSLAIWATGLPDDCALQVVTGPVDYAHAADPGTWISRSLTPSSFTRDVARVVVDTSRSRFIRAQVLDRSGQVIGSSNPIWLLRSPPPGGIPRARRAD